MLTVAGDSSQVEVTFIKRYVLNICNLNQYK